MLERPASSSGPTAYHQRNRRTQVVERFTPLSIPGALFWVESDRIEGLSDGNTVTNWYDLSPNRNDFTRFGTATPQYKTSQVNGLPCVRFYSSPYGNGGLEVANVTDFAYLRSSVTFWSVFKVRSHSNFQVILHKGDGVSDAGSQWDFIPYHNAFGQSDFALHIGSGNTVLKINDPTAWTYAIWTVNGRHSFAELNGTTATATASADTNSIAATYKLTMGALSGGSYPSDIDIAACGMYGHGITMQQFAQLKDYLKKKYAV